ncbi:MAG TPA: AgmX/PglI C-terminal domain-containing protein [Polyangia bacterium]
MNARRFTILLSTVASLALLACGSSPPPPARGPAEPPAPDRPSQEAAPAADDGMRLGGDGLLGTLDETDINRVMQPKLEAFGECFSKHKRLGYVGGTVTLKYRVARDGGVKKLGYVSDLGAFAVERCVLAIAKDVRFPRPKGGEAELEFPASFRPKQRHRVWDGDKISADVHRHERELKTCAGAPASYQLTFYIGAGGKTSSVGFSSPEPWGAGMEAYAECVTAKAGGWRFTDPLGEITKASYLFE